MRLRTALIILTTLLWIGQGTARAQLRTEFTNLEVLDPDIEQGELLGYMRDFSQHLGVRCQYCHVGEDGQPLGEFDLASDEKGAKRTARLMLRMTRAINSEWVSEIRRPGERVRVQCVSCHRGQRQPRLLEDVLVRTVSRDGIDAAVAQYRRLREQYYGSHTFDFTENALSAAAATLITAARRDDAVRLFQLNLEAFPSSAFLHYLVGRLYAEMDQTAEAVEHLERSLALNERNPPARRLLDSLRQ